MLARIVHPDDEMPDLIDSLMTRFIVFSLSRKIVLLFSRSFFVLYLLTIVQFSTLGYLFALMFLFEALTDYPTGALSDYLGHKKVLFLAYTIYGISFLLVPFASSKPDLIIIFILQAIANGQESGALQSWFDNNYAMIGNTYDPERVAYSNLMGKFIPMNDVIGLAVSILGAILATIAGRRIVFVIQALMMFSLAFIVMKGLKSYYPVNKERMADKAYFQYLFGGIKYVTNNLRVLVFSFGLILDVVAKSVWISLIMIPIYFGYTGTDFLVSILNFGIYSIGMGLVYLTSSKWRNLDPRKFLPISIIVHGILFFGSISFLNYYIPVNNSFSLTAFMILLIGGSVGSALIAMSKLYSSKMLLDVIPNENRNSFYSLIPTISLLLAAVANYFLAQYVEKSGYNSVLLALNGIKIISGAFLFVAILVLGLSSTNQVSLTKNIPLIFDTNLDAVKETFINFRPSPWYISETTKTIWMSLIEIARADGNVSDEEVNILVSCMNSMKEYMDEFTNCFNDGLITLVERKRLEKKRLEILNSTLSQALEDNQVSNDEENLINKIKSILIELEKVEQIAYIGQ